MRHLKRRHLERRHLGLRTEAKGLHSSFCVFVCFSLFFLLLIKAAFEAEEANKQIQETLIYKQQQY